MKQTITHYERELLEQAVATADDARKILERCESLAGRLLLIDAGADQLLDRGLKELMAGMSTLDDFIGWAGIEVNDPTTEGQHDE